MGCDARLEGERVFINGGFTVEDCYRNTKQVRGLAERFSRLDSPEDIRDFVSEYGLLGLSPQESEEALCITPPKYSALPLGIETDSEPISLWFKHIKIMRRLLRLYHTLKRGKKDSFFDTESKLYEIISIKRPSWFVPACITKKNDQFIPTLKEVPWPSNWIIWAEDGEFTGIKLDLNNEASMEDIAALVLSSITSHMLQGGIHLEYGNVIPAKDAPLGYRITERLYTFSPLAAAYYDLWEIITEDRPVITCGFCGRPIEKTGRRGYCNDACKQAAYRIRKQKED